MPVEFNDGVGYHTLEEADDLEAFEFDRGDRFVMWRPRDEERADDDVWAVCERSFLYTVSWIRDRDDVPTRESHHCYKLLSRETFNEIYLSGRELKREPRWKSLEDVDEDGGAP